MVCNKSQAAVSNSEVIKFLEALPSEDDFGSVTGENRDFLRRLYDPLHDIFKAARNTSRVNRDRIQAITELKIPQSLLDDFPNFIVDPLGFWERRQQDLPHYSKKTGLERTKLFLQMAIQLSNNIDEQIILRRFVATSTYKLFKRATWETSRTTPDNIRQFLSASGIPVPDDPDEQKDIVDKYVIIIRRGQRQEKICKEVDDSKGDDISNRIYGPLFFDSIPDNIWEDKKSLAGNDFDVVIRHLRSVKATKTANDLGASSVAKLLLDFHADFVGIPVLGARSQSTIEQQASHHASTQPRESRHNKRTKDASQQRSKRSRTQPVARGDDISCDVLPARNNQSSDASQHHLQSPIANPQAPNSSVNFVHQLGGYSDHRDESHPVNSDFLNSSTPSHTRVAEPQTTNPSGNGHTLEIDQSRDTDEQVAYALATLSRGAQANDQVSIQDHNGDDIPPENHAYRVMPTDTSHLNNARLNTFNGILSNQMQAATPGTERLGQPHPDPSNLMSASDQTCSYDPSIHTLDSQRVSNSSENFAYQGVNFPTSHSEGYQNDPRFQVSNLSSLATSSHTEQDSRSLDFHQRINPAQYSVLAPTDSQAANNADQRNCGTSNQNPGGHSNFLSPGVVDERLIPSLEQAKFRPANSGGEQHISTERRNSRLYGAEPIVGFEDVAHQPIPINQPNSNHGPITAFEDVPYDSTFDLEAITGFEEPLSQHSPVHQRNFTSDFIHTSGTLPSTVSNGDIVGFEDVFGGRY